MRGIYLAAFKANHSTYDIVYQDINGKRDIGGDMLDVDLTPYDFIIATPPCNYYSRANYRRDISPYALSTRHLLPCIINKLIKLNKPFIVENVRNSRIFKMIGLFDVPCFIYIIGRHTYWTNILMTSDILQSFDFKYGGYYIGCQDFTGSKRQGGQNVHDVIEVWLDTIGGYF